SSIESLRPLQIPITIVTAASGNHACALEAFLYHLNATLSQLHTSSKDDLQMLEMRIKNGQQYLETSPDMTEVRGKGDTKLPTFYSSAEKLQEMTNQEQGEDEKAYEIRPKIVVYNMGMGPMKRKKLLFKAIIEAGYIDELYDLDFGKYPDFWRLGTETRGEYGWKAGIIEEVSRRVLESSHTAKSPAVPKKIEPEAKVESAEDEKIREWAAIEEHVDDDSTSIEDEHALDEMEDSSDILLHNLKVEQPHEPGIVLWLDSGDRPSIEFLRWLPSFMHRYGLWTPQSQDDMHKWTHPGLLSYYHDSLDNFPKDESNCNGAVIAFDVKNTTVRNGIMKEWVQCSHIKECIAPEGSSRENHRQDQAALTYLVKTMGFRQQLCHEFPEKFGVKVNQDRFCVEEIAAYPNRIPCDNLIM
ncbi:hypothetical protein BGZ46_005665, partial [Entomortierella lignicola]